MNDFPNRAYVRYYRIDTASPAHLIITDGLLNLIGKSY